MKKQFFLLIAGFIVTSFIFTSCDKDSPAKTKTQLITQSSWKVKSATVNGNPYSLQACQQDNIYTFASTGSGTTDEGATKCNGGDPQTTSFTWSFQTNETLILFSSPLFTGGSNTVNLISISETELVISIAISPGPGPTFNVVVTFQH